MVKINTDFIHDISSLRLYTVTTDENEGVVYLQRFKITSTTTQSDIHKIVDLIEEGKLCFKHGHKKEGTIKYALKDSSLAPKIKKLVLVKIVKSELAIKDKEGKLEQKTVEDKINIDLTKDSSVESKIEKMTEEEAGILQSIKAKLIKVFGLDVLSKNAIGVSTPVSQRKITTHASPSVAPSAKKAAKIAAPKERVEFSKQQLIADEQENQDVRKSKRKAQEVSEELDEKSDERRRKDIKSTKNHEDIRNEDIKKTDKATRRSSKKKKIS